MARELHLDNEPPGDQRRPSGPTRHPFARGPCLKQSSPGDGAPTFSDISETLKGFRRVEAAASALPEVTQSAECTVAGLPHRAPLGLWKAQGDKFPMVIFLESELRSLSFSSR